MNLIRPILFTICCMLALPVWAQTQADPSNEKERVGSATNTASPPPETAVQNPKPPAASFDDRVQREADERVRRSEGELGYLGAAYVAAFLILAVFLWSTRRGQQRLADEVQELQTRLDEALTSNPRGDA